MPRPKLSTNVKSLKGTMRPHREKSEIAAERLDGVPEAPETLSDLAQREWAALAPLVTEKGILTASDMRTFKLLCETLATETEARETIQREGMTLATGSGGAKAHPAIRVMEVARAQSINLLRDFGLTPKARQYVTAVKPEKKKSKWDL